MTIEISKHCNKAIGFILFVVSIFPVISENNYAYSFVRTRTSNGIEIGWKRKSFEVDLFINTSNNDAIIDSMVWQIFLNSIEQWNGHSQINLKANFTSDGLKNKRNDIIFTTSQGFFSSGVLAVTSVAYDGLSGEILEADIYLNDNVEFSPNKGDTENGSAMERVYLGDVLTHELGHLLGLGHGQVRSSSMLFTAFNGQYSTDDDDHMGVLSIYPKENSGGAIKGKIIGSKNLYGIIGTQVQLISAKKGKVIGAIFSGPDGEFEFSNIPLDDVYYIYTNPININASIPFFYLTSRMNFCSNSDYRGSFFSKCNARDEGYPQGIYFKNGAKYIDLGMITIKCKLDSPPEYLDKKLYGMIQNSEFDLKMKQENGSYGNAFVGLFSSKEIEDRTLDIIKIDLSSYSAPIDNYLDLRVISQDFYSSLRTLMKVYRNGVHMGDFPGNSEAISASELDADGNPSANVLARVPLSSNPSDNIFEIHVRPVPIPISSLVDYDLEDFLPSYPSFLDKLTFYFFVANIANRSSAGEYQIVQFRDDYPFEDNKRCPDAPSSIPLTAFTSTLDSQGTTNTTSVRKDKKQGLLPLNCGQIQEPPSDDQGASSNGTGNGVTSFLFGLFMTILLGLKGRRKGSSSF